ncbi:hypothetical protein CTZ27_18720 [Streptomyces griseocarneus]|nr:hypothetical protein CTZ27_18720 [Streptomyces griseocarneus]
MVRLCPPSPRLRPGGPPALRNACPQTGGRGERGRGEAPVLRGAGNCATSPHRPAAARRAQEPPR